MNTKLYSYVSSNLIYDSINSAKSRKVTRYLCVMILTSLLILLSSCAGQDDGTAGIDGTGSGNVIASTAIGVNTQLSKQNITVNGTDYSLDNAQVLIDGKSKNIDSLEEGQLLTVFAKNDASSSDNILQANLVVHNTHVFGSVSQVSSSGLIVLGQMIQISPDTLFSGDNLKKIEQIQIDDMLKISGLRLAQGKFIATLIHRYSSKNTENSEIHDEKSSIPLLEVNGIISNLNLQAQTFMINDLVIKFSNNSIDTSILNNGAYVEVLGIKNKINNTLIAQSVLLNLTDLGENQSLIDLQGFVTLKTDDNSIKVGGVMVEIQNETQFENGLIADLLINRRVLVKGKIIDGKNIQADSIEFLDALLTSHKNKDILTSKREIFSWSDVQAQEYQLLIKSKNQLVHFGVYESDTTEVVIEDLPENGAELTLFLRSIRNGLWTSSIYSFTSVAKENLPNATLLGHQLDNPFNARVVNIEWRDVQADEYRLILQSDDIRFFDMLIPNQTTSITLNNLPNNAANIKMFLDTRHGLGWARESYSFLSFDALENASLSSHSRLDMLTSSAVEFSWDDVNADEYRIIIKNSMTNEKIYDERFDPKTLTAYVTHLPTNGETLYLLLKTRHTNGWHTKTYTLTTLALQDTAVLTSHKDKDILTQKDTLFTWSDVNADSYRLIVRKDQTILFNQVYSSNTLSGQVNDLSLKGNDITVELSTLHGIHWSARQYTFTTSIANNKDSAKLLSHKSGNRLNHAETFHWNNANAQAYELTIQSQGETLFKNTLDADQHSLHIDNLPTNGAEIILTLKTRHGDEWLTRTYSLLAQISEIKSTLLEPMIYNQWQSTAIEFQWEDVKAKRYQLSIRSDNKEKIHNFNGQTFSAILTNLPQNEAAMHVTLITHHATNILEEKYLFVSQPGLANAKLTSHEDGDSLVNGTNIFSWNNVNADEYRLIVKTDIESFHNAFYKPGDMHEVILNNLPSDQGTVTLLLKTRHGNGWFTRAYSFNPEPK